MWWVMPVAIRPGSSRRPKEKCPKREGKCVNPGFDTRSAFQITKIGAACIRLRSKKCQSPNHADASEVNLSTVSWLMKGTSRAVHQSLQRQRVIARRRSAGGGRGAKLRPEPE